MMARATGRYSTEQGGLSRLAEDVALWVGVALIGMRGISELAHEWVCVLRECRTHTHQFPWGFVLSCGLLVLPKTVGRATAGKVWEAIGQGLGRLVGRGRAAGPGEGGP